MKKKTKVNKKKLDSLLLVLLLTAVLLIMSTYAWFTANRTVTVGSIDIHVETASGLMISADGKEWGTSVTVDQIKNAYNNGYTMAANQLPVDLAPTSTALKFSTAKPQFLEMFYGEVNQDKESKDYYLTATSQTANEVNGVNGYYVAFDVFLKSGNPEKNLYVAPDIKEMKYDQAAGTYSVVQPAEERGIANAARVAIIRGTTTTDADSQNSVINNTSTAGGKVLMWEPNYNNHTLKSIANAKDLYDKTITADNEYINYKGINSDISEASKVRIQDTDSDSRFTDVTPTWASKKGTIDPSLKMPTDLADGGENYGILRGATKYRIYMWIEGQDIDCENNASGSYLQFDLSFSLDEGETVYDEVENIK